MELALIQLFNGVQYGLLIFLAASGLTLVFVSAKPPSEALYKAATHAEARVYHRAFR